MEQEVAVPEGPIEPEREGVAEHRLSSIDDEEGGDGGGAEEQDVICVGEGAQRPPPLMDQRIDARDVYKNSFPKRCLIPKNVQNLWVWTPWV